MTIDPPFFVCWALATWLLAVVVLDDKPHLWPSIGIVVGVGFLAKYAMFLWLPIAGLVLLADRGARPSLRTIWPWLGTAIAFLFTLPVLIWNAKHNWVSFFHVARQTGGTEGGFLPLGPLEYVATQFVIAGPVVIALIVGGMMKAWRGGPDPTTRAARFLAIIGLFFFLIVGLASFKTRVQPNWPAPAYFTLMILAAWFLATRLADIRKWRHWRGWFWGNVIVAIPILLLVHDTPRIYPLLGSLLERLNRGVKPADAISIRDADPTARLMGWHDLGRRVGDELAQMPAGTFVLSDDYQWTALLAFYTPGQPLAYNCGSYFQYKPERLNQYDMWPNRSLEPIVNGLPNPLMGRDAIFVGYFRSELKGVFDRIERQPDLTIVRNGQIVRSFRIWRLYGFKGMVHPAQHKA